MLTPVWRSRVQQPSPDRVAVLLINCDVDARVAQRGICNRSKAMRGGGGAGTLIRIASTSSLRRHRLLVVIVFIRE